MFGLTASLELVRRGYSVTVLDPGPLPHPLAASNDTSRMVRMDYGDDELYVELAGEAIDGWHEWNQRSGKTLYHEDGFLMASSRPLAPGEFEYDSFHSLSQRGYDLQRMDSGQIMQRYPLWNGVKYTDGYLNPKAGWAEAENTVIWLGHEAKSSGVNICSGIQIAGFIEAGNKVTGVVSADEYRESADLVVVAAGAWTAALLPELTEVMQPVGQPIIYLQPTNPNLYRGPQFPPFAADIPKTGWYGFPANADGIVKISNHGPGRPMTTEEPRDLSAAELSRFNAFIKDTIPSLAEAPIVNSRLCLYCDTWDGNFWIGHHPDKEGLVVAAGGSGHGFKFAPVMGGLIADAVERVDTPYSRRFAWRPKGEATAEAIRYTGE